ncbi:glucose 1-dehydrogenase [Paenibacillus sacheonensis]|uniref:Glucose 1-dehydrogenase n=1 Tax=Paenibacillus sacheonensis TaxID=742054 RepID=A0A7X4YT55_9BACL|nr:glucose 1-dehydrogenase [Paenibacillus sacheonensis]MBM7568404.1 NAD(P)-dependent dehydrogenase (short-subunit alcohol dehydrogenase family) [Paenibacillus sacheonensis]NBC72102.1 glucose 1-dehydrogenase [Paenibacillus sacheonensis]
MKLQGKSAVITGAASGMGKSMALLFASEGASVVVADINASAVDTVVQEIASAGGSAKGVTVNVTNEEDVARMIDTAVESFGKLDILVNNAGVMDAMMSAEAVTDAMWDKVMSINVTGPMRAIRKAIPIMKEQGQGVIINTASVGGLFGSRAGLAYTASKHAVVGMTKNVGFQYGKLGIRCNAIAPGAVMTNIGIGGSEPDPYGLEQAMAGMGLQRTQPGDPNDIASVALFLASDDAKFVNGTVVTADGGWSAY